MSLSAKFKTDGELYEALRANLKPQGTLDVVNLRLPSSTYAATDFVVSCIEVAEKKSRMAAINRILDRSDSDLNPLESLGMMVLVKSAWLDT